MGSLTGRVFQNCFRLENALRCKAQAAAQGEKQGEHVSSVFFQPSAKGIYNPQQCNLKAAVLHRHDWSVKSCNKTESKQSWHRSQYSFSLLHGIVNANFSSLGKWNSATISNSYLQFKYISIFPCVLASGIWQGLVRLLLLINPHVAICLVLTNPIQEHIPVRAWKPSGCVDGRHLLGLIYFLNSLLAFLEQVNVQLE